MAVLRNSKIISGNLIPNILLVVRTGNKSHKSFLLCDFCNIFYPYHLCLFLQEVFMAACNKLECIPEGLCRYVMMREEPLIKNNLCPVDN